MEPVRSRLGTAIRVSTEITHNNGLGGNGKNRVWQDDQEQRKEEEWCAEVVTGKEHLCMSTWAHRKTRPVSELSY